MARNHLFFFYYCKSWVHPKCNNLNFIKIQHVSGSDNPRFCFKYNSNILPFGKLNNQNFQLFILSFTEASSNTNQNKENSTLLLKPPNFSLLFNQFNDLSAESNRNNPENVINSSSLSLFHFNTYPLNNNFDNLEYLLKTTSDTFDIIAITLIKKLTYV